VVGSPLVTTTEPYGAIVAVLGKVKVMPLVKVQQLAGEALS